MTKHKYIKCDFDIPYEESYSQFLSIIRDMSPEIADKVNKRYKNAAALLSADVDARVMESVCKRDSKTECRKS